jgi:beta-hydroxylase
VLRYHLGLLVPSDPTRCGIRVGDERRHWEAGRSLVFDDTFEHEAWNESDEPRVVLFVDFARQLPAPLDAINRALLRLIGASPFIKNIFSNLDAMQAAKETGAGAEVR